MPACRFRCRLVMESAENADVETGATILSQQYEMFCNQGRWG